MPLMPVYPKQPLCQAQDSGMWTLARVLDVFVSHKEWIQPSNIHLPKLIAK